jgi:hypothetical protein
MCQCGCGDTNIERAYDLPGGKVLGVQVYRGCDGCFNGPAVSIMLFDRKGAKEWVGQWVEHEKITPDENGGNDGLGIGVPLFEVEDLRKSAKRMAAQETLDEYGDIDDWLQDNGLELIQGAMEAFRLRRAEEEKKRMERKP